MGWRGCSRLSRAGGVWVALAAGVAGYLGPLTTLREAAGAVSNCPASRERLPDLVQLLPTNVSVDMHRTASGHVTFRLAFTTTMANQGPGPLKIVARRWPTQSSMRAAQLVVRRGGGICRYPDIGRVRFDFNQSHDHWHLEGFDRYTLTGLDGSHPAAPTRKAGFCLNDDQPAPRRPRTSPARPVFVSDCKLDQPGALRLTEGISSGWSDVYPAYVEGQVLDVTRVPAGRYILANRVDPARTLRERSYANNAASVLIRLRWPHGREQFPAVQVLNSCPHSTICHPAHTGG